MASVATAWRRLHDFSTPYRVLLKIGVFAVVALFVFFPKPWLLPRLLTRVQDLNRLIEPRHPDLEALEALVRQDLPNDAGARQALRRVEHVVRQRVPYAFDWDNWGVVEYLPTTGEALDRGREDCDGQAVVAAALLRRMGYDAWLVCDMLHMWVATPEGETMSPGKGNVTLASAHRDDPGGGTRASVSFGLLPNLVRGLSFGVSVFPLPRVLILVFAFCALSLHPGSRPRRTVAGVTLLLSALAIVRIAGRDAANDGDLTHVVAVASAFALGVLGWLLLILRGPVWPLRSAPAPRE